MRLATRSIAFAVVVSLLGGGPLATFARAQQSAQPPAEQPAPQDEQPARSAEQPAPQPEQPTQSAEQPMQAAPERGPQPAEQPAQAAPPPAPQPTAEPAQAASPAAPQPVQMPAPPAREPQAMQEPVIFEEPSESTVWYGLGATIVNFVFIPGKAVTCVLGMAVGGGLLLVTLGAAYKGSVAFAKEGCGGKWVLTAKDLRGTDYILGTGERRE